MTVWLIDSLLSADTSVHKESALPTGRTLRGERCETDNAHKADVNMWKEAEQFAEEKFALRHKVVAAAKMH